MNSKGKIMHGSRITRRDWLKTASGATADVALGSGWMGQAFAQGKLVVG